MDNEEKYVNEMWKTLEEDDNYSISDCGRIKNNTTDTILNENVAVCFSNGRSYITQKICYLVARAFVIQESDAHTEVEHIDGCELNNSFTNLKWVVPKNVVKMKAKKNFNTAPRKPKMSVTKQTVEKLTLIEGGVDVKVPPTPVPEPVPVPEPEPLNTDPAKGPVVRRRVKGQPDPEPEVEAPVEKGGDPVPVTNDDPLDIYRPKSKGPRRYKLKPVPAYVPEETPKEEIVTEPFNEVIVEPDVHPTNIEGLITAQDSTSIERPPVDENNTPFEEPIVTDTPKEEIQVDSNHAYTPEVSKSTFVSKFKRKWQILKSLFKD
jgi:hypothetical protein